MVDEDFLLEYLDRINAEIQKVRRAVQAINEGVPFTEAFDEELFTEGKHDREISAALHQATRMIHHLLKFRLSTSDRPLKSWYDSIDDAREKLIEATDWYWGPRKDTYCSNVVKKVLDQYNDIYSNAIGAYEDDADNYPDLKPGLKYIPDECPWTLRDLIRTPYSKLLAMIPAVDEEDEERLEKRMERIVELGYKD